MSIKNPLANESIISKVRKKSDRKQEAVTGTITAELLGINDAMTVCAKACACCWDRPIPEGYDNVAEYVAKRSRIGHTSVVEHSNFVMYLHVDKAYEEDLISILDIMHYLYSKTIPDSTNTGWHVIIGGSYRGYCDLYRETDDLNNAVLKAIAGCLYVYAHSAAFEDICKLGLMDKMRFMNVEPDENHKLLNKLSQPYENEYFEILGIDDIKKLYTNLYVVSKEAAEKITTYDLIKFVTVSVMFKNMSRTCTHQLVRHRNAITQESQRYVDYSKACFNSPEIFKPEKYDKDHKYTVRFASSAPMNLTLSEIGAAMCEIYGMLSNPVITGANYALLKEDARAFLPSNVQCKKIYITFTYKSLLKFLNLREDKAAQAEIRTYAVALGNWIRENTEFGTKELCDLYTQPRLLIEDPFKIDIDEGIVEEQIELTPEDYIKAAGLDVEDNEEVTESKDE